MVATRSPEAQSGSLVFSLWPDKNSTNIGTPVCHSCGVSLSSRHPGIVFKSHSLVICTVCLETLATLIKERK
jgi:hypothetical protein